MTYRLFYSPGACSMAAHIVLEEVHADFTLEGLNLAQGAHLQPDYLAINPKARVPALEIPGQPRVLTELPAILAFLARQYPQAGLLPADSAIESARGLEWLGWLAAWVHATGYGALWRPARFSADTTLHDGIRAQGRQTIIEANRKIERHFADGNAWALASGYSIVDPFLLVLYRWGNRIGLDMRTDCPAWTASSLQAAQRPAVQTVLQREAVTLDG
ncbi:glutathione S-transferase N-terminal domain-containing protein [Bordetella petrii]|uniref:glutathione S-transferase N-terminal domain-containing protein n=1 Tax=Bordetella petrii TaxID=94624 RepID=UPI001E40AE22|nr:glutathione S-transferase N-terminal domain-containing protein [Bordetella petrii]MCD0503459.1 glutathione S-transferase N-terminal domain-containing protein [Bordetella petrii]